MNSSFNTALSIAYGDELWARLLLRLGYVNQDVVDAANTVTGERARVRDGASAAAWA